jgi:hypothetical protein
MRIDQGCGNNAEGEQPRLVMTRWAKGVPLAYKCSRCEQTFILPEDQTPKEGVVELWAAFTEHVHEEHSAGAESAKGCNEGAGEEK